MWPQSIRSCDVLTNATGCALVNTTNLDAQTGQQVIENGVNGGQINPILETVEFTIASPQVCTQVSNNIAGTSLWYCNPIHTGKWCVSPLPCLAFCSTDALKMRQKNGVTTDGHAQVPRLRMEKLQKHQLDQ
jgi:hypothetical protein